MESARFKVRRIAIWVTAPIWMPLLLIAYATHIIFLPSEFRLRRDMRMAKRWTSIRSFKRAGPSGGTIIIESVKFDYSVRRIWWTPDDVAAISPVAPPVAGEDGFDAQDRYSWHPYDRWLTETYIWAADGGATLLSVWNSKPTEALRGQFPGRQIVVCFSGGEEMAAFTRGRKAWDRIKKKQKVRERRRSARLRAAVANWKGVRPHG